MLKPRTEKGIELHPADGMIPGLRLSAHDGNFVLFLEKRGLLCHTERAIIGITCNRKKLIINIFSSGEHKGQHILLAKKGAITHEHACEEETISRDTKLGHPYC